MRQHQKETDKTNYLKAVKRRIYDPQRGCYIYDIRFKTRSSITDRTIKVAEAFGLGIDEEKEHIIYKDFQLRLGEGDVVYITGDSGSGKSLLLKALAEDLGDKAININEVETDPEKPLIDAVGKAFQEALTLLSKVGLNDAFLFLRKYTELSDGQRYRYRIAKMIDSGKKFWLADEFCSTLDRTTASIVAYNIQKMARRNRATLLVATTHTDLGDDLNPSIRIHKGWAQEISVDYRKNEEAPNCTVTQDVAIREGSMKDYKKLSYLHYRQEESRFTLKIFAMERQGELIGVITYNAPPISTSGRKEAVGYSPSIEELNRDWATIKRVIVHPKYRTTGLGTRLVNETLPLCGRKHVELIAVMAQYNPFAEHAGMKRVFETKPHPKIHLALERLQETGFNPVMMSSVDINLEKLKELKEEGIRDVEAILLGLPSVYYKRLIGGSRPYFNRRDMHDWLESITLQRLARALHTLAILSQVKVYLYWRNSDISSYARKKQGDRCRYL